MTANPIYFPVRIKINSYDTQKVWLKVERCLIEVLENSEKLEKKKQILILPICFMNISDVNKKDNSIVINLSYCIGNYTVVLYCNNTLEIYDVKSALDASFKFWLTCVNDFSVVKNNYNIKIDTISLLINGVKHEVKLHINCNFITIILGAGEKDIVVDTGSIVVFDTGYVNNDFYVTLITDDKMDIKICVYELSDIVATLEFILFSIHNRTIEKNNPVEHNNVSNSNNKMSDEEMISIKSDRINKDKEETDLVDENDVKEHLGSDNEKKILFVTDDTLEGSGISDAHRDSELYNLEDISDFSRKEPTKERSSSFRNKYPEEDGEKEQSDRIIDSENDYVQSMKRPTSRLSEYYGDSTSTDASKLGKRLSENVDYAESEDYMLSGLFRDIDTEEDVPTSTVFDDNEENES